MRIAVVGAGPAGVYAVEALRRQAPQPVTVDVFDALPTPYGLVRYGVAPDHPKIKSIERTLRVILETPGVRFLGNVRAGTDLRVEELREYYDAVIYAYGASVDRRLGVPGEDLPGSVSATDLVSWYCGNPDRTLDDVTLDARTAVVIGVGNVALDVARVLARPAEDLARTDVPPPVLDRLRASRITEVHVVGRRGPQHAKFTTKELRELGEIPTVDIRLDPSDLPGPDGGDDLDANARRNLEVFRRWAERNPEERPRRIRLWFWMRPLEIVGDDRVQGVVCERTTLGPDGAVTGTGEKVTLDCELVVRSVGYAGVGVPGLPFDPKSGTVPNDAGRVLREGRTFPGEYVAGWIKRGPTGVIGTNRSDATETVRSLLEDAAAGRLPRPVRAGDDIVAVLRSRQVRVVPWEGWLGIERAEAALGAATGREKAKLHRREDLLSAASG